MSAIGDALAVAPAHMPRLPAPWAPGSLAVRDIATTAFLRLRWLALAFCLPVLAGVALSLIRRGAPAEFGAHVFWSSAALVAANLTASLT